jgi:predicted unusual protein kinase regulating ubiquinone biosynthesis (AarF/ABC1/UbiB family)
MRPTLLVAWSYVKIMSTVVGWYCATLLGFVSTQRAVFRACRFISSENVLFVKCIQAMSSHPFIPKTLHPILQAYTNDAPVHAHEIDHELLRYIGQKYNVVLASTPAHTGMVAIVFYGTMDEKPVVVKLAKMRIGHRIVYGCAHLRLLWQVMMLLSRWSANVASACDALATVIESNDYLLMQCDLTHEQRAMRAVRDRWRPLQAQSSDTSSICNHRNRINVPYVCSDPDDPRATDFFIMERVHGVPAFQLSDKRLKRRCVSLVQYFILAQALLLDYYHTDMHSGNVLFDYDEDADTLTMGVYDYGMHVRVGNDERAFMSSILELLMGNEDTNKETFDAMRFCFLMFEMDHVPMHNTAHLRDLCAHCGKDMLTGAFNPEAMHRFIAEVSLIIGCKPKLREKNMQLLLGTSMVNSLTYELSDSDVSVLAEIGVRVYEDLVLS